MHDCGTVSPTHQVAYVWTRVYIKCFSRTQVKWTNEKGNQLYFYMTSGNDIMFRSVTEKDSGYYTCHGTLDDSGRSFQASSHLIVGCEHSPIEHSMIIHYW